MKNRFFNSPLAISFPHLLIILASFKAVLHIEKSIFHYGFKFGFSATRSRHSQAETFTLRVNERSADLAKSGKQVFRLGFGQSPFPVPEEVVQASPIAPSRSAPDGRLAEGLISFNRDGKIFGKTPGRGIRHAAGKNRAARPGRRWAGGWCPG